MKKNESHFLEKGKETSPGFGADAVKAAATSNRVEKRHSHGTNGGLSSPRLPQKKKEARGKSILVLEDEGSGNILSLRERSGKSREQRTIW